MKIILVGNYQEYQNYIHLNGLEDKRDTIYGDFSDKMAGIEVDDLIEVGTFWTKENAGELKEFALTRLRKTG